jgi:hypothetical protein
LKREQNQFKASYKSLVLQRLALFSQSRSADDDRVSLDLPVLLSQMHEVLPSLMLEESHAQPMLDEIVERSGLLLEMDKGERYQFAHLSLQEFFAAKALQGDTKRLLSNFTAHPDAWREVVRLWCGLKDDSTALIRAVCYHDPILAFECLADARHLQPAYARRLTIALESRLLEAAQNSSLARTLGLVAADTRPGGTALFAYLVDNLSDPGRYLAAAAALSLTNLPRAAEVLAEHAGEESDLRPYLARMGDVSVPVLSERASQAEEWALDALYSVGTPAAAQALVLRLWDSTAAVANHAAWLLASLMTHTDVEDSLRSVRLTATQRKEPYIEWIWDPFEETRDSPLPVIAGRIAFVLHTFHMSPPLPASPPLPFDSRLAIPLCAIVFPSVGENVVGRLSVREREKLLASLPEKTEERNAPDRDVVDRISLDPAWRQLLRGLPAGTQSRLLRSLIRNDPTPAPADWQRVRHPLRYTFQASWHARGVKTILAAVLVLNLFGVADQAFFRSQQVWVRAVAVIWEAAMLTGLVGLRRIGLKRDNANLALVAVLTGLVPGAGAVMGIASGNWSLGAALSITGVLGAAVLAGTTLDLWIGTAALFFVGVSTGLATVIGGAFAAVHGDVVADACVGAGLGLVIMAVLTLVPLRGAGDSDSSDFARAFCYGILVGISGVALAYSPAVLAMSWFGLTGSVVIWVIGPFTYCILLVQSARQERRARNPLNGLLPVPEREAD